MVAKICFSMSKPNRISNKSMHRVIEAGMYYPDGPLGLKHLVFQLPRVILGGTLQLLAHLRDCLH